LVDLLAHLAYDLVHIHPNLPFLLLLLLLLLLLSCSKVHAGGQKFVVIVDPGILAIDPSWNDEYKPYTDGIAADVFIRDGFTGAPYMSQV
jgi:hypothetical protein